MHYLSTKIRHGKSGKDLAKTTLRSGFTLIELSIVLVIIGLIVGGVLTGRDLIRTAEVRATITQIEKYNTAANTFRSKYGYLPGDIKDPDASSFGFLPRGLYAGEGDGNGVIEGVSADAPSSNLGYVELDGETATFWVDLSTAKLISETLYYGGPGGIYVTQSAKSIDFYAPAAKLGGSNYIYVWSTGGVNYFGISAVTLVGHGGPQSTAGLTVAQAFGVDSKIDDGLPQSGNVTAFYLSSNTFTAPYVGWAGTSGTSNMTPYTNAVLGSATTCFDNNSSAGMPQRYSVEISNGSNVTCALSTRFQ